MTTYDYANGGRTATVTMPGGASRVTDAYLDRQAKSVTGTAVVAQYLDYGVNADGTVYSQVFTGGGLASPRWLKTTTDWLGRSIKVEKPGFTGANLVGAYTYNEKGQLRAETVVSGASKLVADHLYEYDELGEQVRAGFDLDASGTLTALSADRLSETGVVYQKGGNDWFMVTTNKTYLVNNSDAASVTTRAERLTNFTAGAEGQTISDETVADEAGNATRVTTTVDRAARKVTVKTDTPDSSTDAVSVSVNGLLQSSTPTTPENATTYAYDALGRQTGVTSPRGGNTATAYSATTGQVLSTGDAARTTTYEYYPATHASAGRLKSQTNAAGKKVYFNYSSRGGQTQVWGDTTYPLEYVYDEYGQQTELRTFRAGRNWAAGVWPASAAGAADVTRWVYQSSTGLLTQKQDAASKQVTFTYDSLGRPVTRTWARPAAGGGALTSTHSYDPLTGELSGIDYSDATPDVTFVYDRGGRQGTVTDAAGTHTRTFNARGELETDQVSGGLLDAVQVRVNYDQHLRRQSLQAALGGTTLTSQTYGYDSVSRLETVTSGPHTATYAYYPATGQLNTTTFTGGTQVGRSYDSLGRLQTISTTATAAGTVASHTYTYNNLHQRTKVTGEDGSYWSFSYNDRGELVSGKKYWADGTPIWGAQTEYSFDNVGNRTSAKAGGNPLNQLRQSGYTSNALNQYTQRANPGAVDVAGTAHSAAAVSVNDQPAARKGDYFYKELAVDNAAAPANPQVGVVGARQNFGAGGEDAVTQQGGRVFVPPAAEAYAYDEDGNLMQDGRWQYEWDAENRLASMQAAAGVPAEARLRLEFAYDYMGRRVQKKVYGWSVAAANYQLQSVTKFVYDGWDLVAELEGSNLVRKYAWGGGELLLITGGGSTYQVGYDGNQNITALVSANDGTLAARYDYDAFGQTLRATGAYAAQNPLRFSGKYADTETGLLYYGLRYYNPQTGRWISRDPSGESSGLNLYGFINNDGVNGTDFLGLWRREGLWTGKWLADHRGVAVAECGDSLEGLAELITGSRADRRLLRVRGQVQPGLRVDISPLLRVFENRVRQSVVAAAKRFYAHGFNHGSDYMREDQIDRYFDPRVSEPADCADAAWLILSKGLIDNLKPGEYDQLGLHPDNIPTVKRDGSPEQMLLGDMGYFYNYEEYGRLVGGNFQGENVVKIGRNQFFGWVGGRPSDYNWRKGVKTADQWVSELQDQFLRAKGVTGPGKVAPHFTGKIQFLDTAIISMMVFDLRKQNLQH